MKVFWASDFFMKVFWASVFFMFVLLGVGLTYLAQGLGLAAPPPSLKTRDWLNLAFTGAALFLSAGAFCFSWRKSKQDTFLSIHEKMVTSDLQEGRRMLFTEIKTPEDVERLFQHDREAYQKINRALAMYDVLGVYVKRGYILEDWVMEEWRSGLAKAGEPGRLFIDHRCQQGIPSNWPNFLELSRRAASKSRKRFTSRLFKGRTPD